jgi:hypothetical protein
MMLKSDTFASGSQRAGTTSFVCTVLFSISEVLRLLGVLFFTADLRIPLIRK